MCKIIDDEKFNIKARLEIGRLNYNTFQQLIKRDEFLSFEDLSIREKYAWMNAGIACAGAIITDKDNTLKDFNLFINSIRSLEPGFDKIIHLIENQKPLEPEFAQAINEDFWDMYKPIESPDDKNRDRNNVNKE